MNELRVALEQPHGTAAREPVLHTLDVSDNAPSGAVQVVLQHLQEVASPARAQVRVAQPATRTIIKTLQMFSFEVIYYFQISCVQN